MLFRSHPIEFARLVLSGELDSYLKGHAKDYASQKERIKNILLVMAMKTQKPMPSLVNLCDMTTN